MPKSRVVTKGAGVAGLIKRLGKPPEVKIGILDNDAASGDGLSNLEVGIINEFGAPAANVPERSFLRRTADLKSEQWNRLLKKGIQKATEGKLTLEQAYELVAIKAVADVKATITRGAGVPPPNKPSTIRKKGSSRPLIDSSQMMNSITYTVNGDGPKRAPRFNKK